MPLPVEKALVVVDEDFNVLSLLPCPLDGGTGDTPEAGLKGSVVVVMARVVDVLHHPAAAVHHVELALGHRNVEQLGYETVYPTRTHRRAHRHVANADAGAV